jgi:hypothetical protein
MFVVCMSLVRVLMWVKGKAEQNCSLTFCVFGQTRSKCSYPQPPPNHSLNKASMHMAHLSTNLALRQVVWV